MTKVVSKCAHNTNHILFICDFSPPRGGGPNLLETSRHLNADFISVAYNPGKSARVNSAIAAHWIKENTGQEVIFTLATRDMNKIAIQSLLLGAQLLGLENLMVVEGDGFSEREHSLIKEVYDFRPSKLLRSINQMNYGLDFKGLKLQHATDFCAGASIDLERDLKKEIKLTQLKIEAGAQFFISQPTFNPNKPIEFMDRYAQQYGKEISQPIFHGIQMMSRDSIGFGNIPTWVSSDLNKGRSGEDIASQVLQSFVKMGLRTIYLVPPILKGGLRDYDAAQSVIESFRR